LLHHIGYVCQGVPQQRPPSAIRRRSKGEVDQGDCVVAQLVGMLGDIPTAQSPKLVGRL
jgi:hypothetical protein